MIKAKDVMRDKSNKLAYIEPLITTMENNLKSTSCGGNLGKLSSATAKDIHVIQKDSRYVVFHAESLSLFTVTKNIGELLKFNEISSKYINSKADDIINNILNDISEKIVLDSTEDLKMANSELSSLTLLISQDCNLRCRYCYADHGTYGSQKKLMSYNTAKKCIDKLLSKKNDNHIVFFGGEPLLNFSLIKKIDSYLNRKKISVTYTTITNGTIMNDEIKKFINEKFLSLWISMDGPKDINDWQRFGLAESVHNRVIKTIDKLFPRSYPITIKSVVTKRSINNLSEIIEYISSLNIDSMSINSVKDVPPQNELFMSDEDYITYINELANNLASYIKKIANGEEVKLVSYISPILMQMISKTRKIHGCEAGWGFLTITTHGDVYPCHRYIGLKEFYMGNVHDEGFPSDKLDRLREMLYRINVHNSPKCNTCWARFLCGGACHWRSYVTHGDLSRPTERRCMETKTILEALLPEIADIFSDEVKTKNILKYLKLGKQNEVMTALSH